MSTIQEKINNGSYSDNIPRAKETANFYLEDLNIQYFVHKYLPESMRVWADQELTAFGARVAGPIDERAAYTDKEGRPVLIKYNRLGEDISEIRTNEGYKKTVAEVYGAGIVSYLYHPAPGLGQKVPYLYSYVMGYLLSQSEPGFYCPVTLTLSAAYLVDRYASEELKNAYLPGLTTTQYEELYEGATWLTERQGGSDVGANLTEAHEIPDRQHYLLTGEKFFASNAGAMVATVLARINDLPGTKGLGLFLVPWKKPNQEKNNVYVRRLKDKLGVIAVPSAEVILEDAEGYLIGEPDKGFKYMAEALNISRISNAVASVGILQRAFQEAKHYTEQRKAFGKTINQFSMVQQMLVDMLVELEVNTGAVFEMIHLFDKVVTSQTASAEEQKVVRLLIPLLKYRTGEIAVEGCHTAIELHGGNGYIEEYVTPRLLRDAQVLTVWEGTSNILALDLWRVIQKEQAHEAFFSYLTRSAEQLHHHTSKSLVSEVRTGLKEIEEILRHIQSLPEQELTYKLKGIADYMIDLYLLINILKEAEEQYMNDQNHRKFIVALLFHKKRFKSSSHRGLLDKEFLDLQYFDQLVNYRHIDRI